MNKIIEIKTRDYWFKVVDMLQQNWALIDKKNDSNGYTIYFIHDLSGVFDHIDFSTKKDAIAALRRNNFKQYSKDLEAHKFITPPQAPFFEDKHPNGPIYSSGMYWK